MDVGVPGMTAGITRVFNGPQQILQSPNVIQERPVHTVDAFRVVLVGLSDLPAGRVGGV
jgi:hypothetical protein